MFPDKKYSIIYADPPWFYNGGRKKEHRFNNGARGHYPVMKMGDIQALPVFDISERNAALFLWVTFPNLIHGIKTMEAWGNEV